MRGIVIEHILKTNPATSNYYQGFNTFDIPLPDSLTKPAIIVLNTDNFEGPGEHWCVANFLANDVCEFFDSYGKKPCYYNFDKILYAHCKTIVYNPFRVQGNLPMCGHHILFFILKRYNGVSAAEILNSLYSKTDLFYNDMLVYKFIEHNFGETFARNS